MHAISNGFVRGLHAIHSGSLVEPPILLLLSSRPGPCPKSLKPVHKRGNVLCACVRPIVTYGAGIALSPVEVNTCRYSAKPQTEMPRPTAASVARGSSCSGIGNRGLNALPPCTKFRQRFAVTIAPVPALRPTQPRVFRFRIGTARLRSPVLRSPALYPSGESKQPPAGIAHRCAWRIHVSRCANEGNTTP